MPSVQSTLRGRSFAAFPNLPPEVQEAIWDEAVVTPAAQIFIVPSLGIVPADGIARRGTVAEAIANGPTRLYMDTRSGYARWSVVAAACHRARAAVLWRIRHFQSPVRVPVEVLVWTRRDVKLRTPLS